MTWERDVDRALEGWMQDGPEILPDRVLTDALARVDRTPQLLFPRVAHVQPGWLVAAAVLVLLIAAQLLWLAPQRIGPAPEPTAPRSLEPSAIIEVEEALVVAAADQEVWVTSDDAIVRIEPATGDTESFPVPVPANGWSGLTVADDTLWTGSYFGGTVYRIDRQTGEIVAEIDTLSSAVSITAVPGGAWVAVGGNQAQFIGDDAIAADEPVPAGTTLSYGYGSLWIGNTGGHAEILRADPLTGEIIARIPVSPENRCWAVPAGGAIWSGCFIGQSTTLTRIDPATNDVVAMIDTGVWPGIVEIDGAPWVLGANEDGAMLQRIDLASNEIDRTLVIGPEFDPDNAVVVGDSLWVPNDGRNELWRFPLSDIRSP